MATVFRLGARAFVRRPIAPFSPSFTGTGTGSVFRTTAQRRATSTATAGDAAAQSWFVRMWRSPVGFKTVHFWAPVLKWAIVLAGISDFARPAEKLSLTQNLALTATGAIWTRWCFIITPKNYLLAAVNFFLALVGTAQVSRILLHHQSLKETEKKRAVVAGTKV